MNYRSRSVLLVIASIIGMLFALWLQHYRLLEPCPLCIFQRVGVIAMGVFAFAGALLPARFNNTRIVLAVLACLSILWSLGVAARHVWLQYLPANEVPACGPGLEYWLQVFPFNEVVTQVLHGSGECAKVDWTFLGISLPHWSLAFFTVLLWQCLKLALPSKNSIFRENRYIYKP